ncbi:MAG: iron-containing alcohol dehydrogenase [Deltaproteobacteria bacterium]|nr:iron-containing alcohol dehydrogenase [Deltaproteobacteria bacterium]
MKILRVDIASERITFESLREEWRAIGGSALIAKIMNESVPPMADPLGPENLFIIAVGPLAGTGAPQLGRISVGAKSPLTLGIKEANSGGPAGQILDKLGIRAVIVQGSPRDHRLYCLYISRDEAALIPADEYRGMKNYELADKLRKQYGEKIAVICTGIAGERKYKGASVSFTDMFGDPSRNAARGGLGAVMGSKGLKAILIDPSQSALVDLAHSEEFRKIVKSWVETLRHDISCSLYSRFGTPFAISNSASHGTLPSNNYRLGRPANFIAVSGSKIQEVLFERGGKMHGCMPGCVVQCSIIYPDKDGKRLCSAYEYETIAMLGTNLGIVDHDVIARLKFMCDDLGLDAIETGSSLGLAAEAGKMSFGDWQSVVRLLNEVKEETELGIALGNGVVATATYLNISRIPAYKGQALPAHDPRSVKGTGVTYLTSPMGADHTAGLTYRNPRNREKQGENSLRSQIQAATCDAFGYCLNSVPGGRASIYSFFADLMNARYGLQMTSGDIMEIGKQTLRDQLAFNEKAEFSKMDSKEAAFIRKEAIAPTDQVFDVEDEEVKNIWKGLDSFQEKEKVWEVRIPPLPEMMFGAGVVGDLGARLRPLKLKKVLVTTDPVMFSMGRADEVCKILQSSGIGTVIFSEVEPDPPIELIERAGKIYKDHGCDGIVGLGGGSSMDTAKAVGLRVTHGGEMREYESIVGGTAKIKPLLPPIICIPTTSGTGSEVNPYAVITDKERDLKFMLMSNYLIPKLAVIDPLCCKTMPAGLTVDSGIDALAHCIEGYVSLAIPYHPYFEAMAVYGVKLIGRSLVQAYKNGNDIGARTDMCMAAICGGTAFLKGLGIGHAITHVLGAHYHLPHGRAAIYGLLCFVKANKETCKEQFIDLAQMLNRSNDLEEGLLEFYRKLDIPVQLKGLGIPKEDLKRIAFYASRDAVNMATDPTSISEKKILELLQEIYE